jgi:hypothetical protein
MQITEPTNNQLILMAIRQAKEARGCEITDEAVRQYLFAFQGTPAEKIQAALTRLFAIQQNNRVMPSPREVLDQVRTDGRDQYNRRALPEPSMSDADRRFASAQGPLVGDYLAGKITQGEYASATIAQAKGCGLGPETFDTIRSTVQDWLGSDERIGKPMRMPR